MKSKWSKLHITLKIGLILLILCFGPSLIQWGLFALGINIASKPLSLVLGILNFITFLPSLILIIVGGILTFLKLKKEKERE